jgi:hypothetical protein
MAVRARHHSQASRAVKALTSRCRLTPIGDASSSIESLFYSPIFKGTKTRRKLTSESLQVNCLLRNVFNLFEADHRRIDFSTSLNAKRKRSDLSHVFHLRPSAK